MYNCHECGKYALTHLQADGDTELCNDCCVDCNEQ